MSLGPPFDSDHEAYVMRVGALLLGATLAGVAIIVVASGVSLHRHITIDMKLSGPGQLRQGADVRVAGLLVGEVTRMDYERAVDPTSRTRPIIARLTLRKDIAAALPASSEFFVFTPSVLGEAHLEIGVPPRGADVHKTLTDGDVVIGSDPPDIDRFITHTENATRMAMALLAEDAPEIDALVSASRSLHTTLTGLAADTPSDGARDAVSLAAVFRQAKALYTLYEDLGGSARFSALGDEAHRIGPLSASFMDRSLAMQTEVENILALFPPERRARLAADVARMSATITRGEAIYADVQKLAHFVESGHGSIGGLLFDRELYDDLHESSRLLKSQPWTLIVKSHGRDPSLRPAGKSLPKN